MKSFLLFTILFISINCYSNNDVQIFEEYIIDLDGDNNKEKIKVEDYKLHINNNELNIYCLNFLLFDIDKDDKYTELATKSVHPGGGPIFNVYRFDKEEYILFGSFHGWISTNGNGILIHYFWYGFFNIEVRYKLDIENQSFIHIKQKFYKINELFELRKEYIEKYNGEYIKLLKCKIPESVLEDIDFDSIKYYIEYPNKNREWVTFEFISRICILFFAG